MIDELPHILVLLPTRNRPADVERCLQSLCVVAYPSWELLIIDQSDDSSTERVVESHRDRLPALTYRRMQERGQTRGRNAGLRAAGPSIVAYLDDDCTVSAGWLAGVAATFRRHPAATIVFGTLRAAPHDARQVLIPQHLVAEERLVRNSFGKGDSGMGACMYVWPARSAVRRLFDTYLGPGTRWPAADERDFAYRAIVDGDPLALTPSIVVEHHGARSLKDGAAKQLYHGYARANGAMDMKMVRCGDLRSLRRILDEVRLYGTGILSAVLTGVRPTGLGAFSMYLRGLIESFSLPVDRRRYLYTHRRSRRKASWPRDTFESEQR